MMKWSSAASLDVMAQRLSKQIMVVAAVQWILLVTPLAVHAGGWSPNLDAATMVDRADLIIVGIVSTSRPARSNSPFADELWEADLTVIRVLKGKYNNQSIHVIFSPGNYKAELRYKLAADDIGVFFLKNDSIRGFQLLTYGSVAKFDPQFVCRGSDCSAHNPSQDADAMK